MPDLVYYTEVPSRFGMLSIVWLETCEGPRVQRILLPGEMLRTNEATRTIYIAMKELPNPAITSLAEQVQRFLEGEPVWFDIALVDLAECYPFQRRVLLAQLEIPRGRVSTYGWIAGRLGAPRAARAVGTALARNPLPIIVPCHRTIRSDGCLGGFGGGAQMKRAMLELEGVEFSAAGKVLNERFYC